MYQLRLRKLKSKTPLSEPENRIALLTASSYLTKYNHLMHLINTPLHQSRSRIPFGDLNASNQALALTKGNKTSVYLRSIH